MGGGGCRGRWGFVGVGGPGAGWVAGLGGGWGGGGGGGQTG